MFQEFGEMLVHKSLKLKRLQTCDIAWHEFPGTTNPRLRYLSPRNTKHPYQTCLHQENILLLFLVVVSNNVFTPLPGEMIQFDEQIFQMHKKPPASILQSTLNLTHGVSHLFGTVDHQTYQEYKKFQEEAAKRDHRTTEIFWENSYGACWHILIQYL